MNKEEIKIYFKWLFFGGIIESNVDSFKSFLEWIKKPTNVSYVLIFLAVILLYLYGKILYELIAFLLILGVIFQLRARCLAGEHIGWNRKRLEIKSKKELLKKEWDKSKGEDDPKLQNSK